MACQILIDERLWGFNIFSVEFLIQFGPLQLPSNMNIFGVCLPLFEYV